MRNIALSMFSHNAMQFHVFSNPNAKVIFMKQTPTVITTCDRPFGISILPEIEISINAKDITEDEGRLRQQVPYRIS